MDQPIDFLFGGGDKSVEPHGGPSSDGGIGWHNIAGMVGGGGGCLGLMNKICRFLHQKSQCFGSVSFTPQKNLMVLIQILCFLFEFLLVHWYFQPFFHSFLIGTTSLEPCQPHVTQGGEWWFVADGMESEGKKQGHRKKVGVFF